MDKKHQISSRIAHYGKSSASSFHYFFTSIDKNFILEGRLDTRQSNSAEIKKGEISVKLEIL